MATKSPVHGTQSHPTSRTSLIATARIPLPPHRRPAAHKITTRSRESSPSCAEVLPQKDVLRRESTYTNKSTLGRFAVELEATAGAGVAFQLAAARVADAALAAFFDACGLFPRMRAGSASTGEGDRGKLQNDRTMEEQAGEGKIQTAYSDSGEEERGEEFGELHGGPSG